MSLDLEKHLSELCEEHQPRLDLCERLGRVRDSAVSIWREQRLKWFTDHRAATHSRHIIKHLGSVLEHLQGTSQKLNAHQLYILLAACYLHDIGMQDFQSNDDRGVEQFKDEDYKRIRKTHPERSRQLIIQRTLHRERDEFKIDLDDDPQYIVPIAVVSQGHGSHYFVDTVEELQGLAHRPGNLPLRGGLLTALLLMGDELDLHEQRATFPPEFALSSTSLLHNHIHHYVTGVDVIDGRTPKHRRISLTFEFPKDSDEYRSDVRNQVATKLRRQIELTKPIIEELTQGELIWDDQVEVKETIDNYDVRRSLLAPKSIMALHELRCDVISAQTINRDELVEAFGEAIKQLEHFQAIEVIDRKDSDWSHIVKHLKNLCRHRGAASIHIGFQLSTAHGPLDVLDRLHNELAKNGWSCPAYNAEKVSATGVQTDSLEVLGQALITDIQTRTAAPSLVLLFERLDEAESDTFRWVAEWLIPALANQDVRVLVIFTLFERDGIEETFEHVRVFRLAPFTKDQISEHLQARFGFSSDQAENEADYLFSSSSGTPGSVHRGLAIKRMQGVKIV